MEGQKGREDAQENVSSCWIILPNREVPGIERGNASWHCLGSVEESIDLTQDRRRTK